MSRFNNVAFISCIVCLLLSQIASAQTFPRCRQTPHTPPSTTSMTATIDPTQSTAPWDNLTSAHFQSPWLLPFALLDGFGSRFWWDPVRFANGMISIIFLYHLPLANFLSGARLYYTRTNTCMVAIILSLVGQVTTICSLLHALADRDDQRHRYEEQGVWTKTGHCRADG